jgi:ADP-ribose pyrophosphatase YjhB (NUDIX family)
VWQFPESQLPASVNGGDRIILICRRNPPYGGVLPGGFVVYDESLESAAVRETKQETGLVVQLVRQSHANADPVRDPRGHTLRSVFIARADGVPRAGDGASDVRSVCLNELPSAFAFDHEKILADSLAFRRRRARCPGR